MTIYSGWQLVVLERFDMEKVLQAIQLYRITFTYLPPPVILAFGKHPLVDKYDLSSLKVLHSGAAPLTRELTEAVWARLQIPCVLPPLCLTMRSESGQRNWPVRD